MDWQQELNTYSPLEAESVGYFAPPRELNAALLIYNRALSNLRNDSPDVALIALRKIVATYPLFAQANLLLGAIQLSRVQIEDARELIERAQTAGLSASDNEKAERYLDEIYRLAETNNKARPAGGTRSPDTAAPIPSAVVLQKIRRPGKVKMASEKEVAEVMRRAQSQELEPEETHVQMERDPIEIVRIVVPIVAAVLGAVLVFWLGALFGPGLLWPQDQPDDKTRLSWLLGRLEPLADQDPSVASLLQDYDTWQKPAPTAGPSTSLTTSAATTSSLPTGTSVPTSASSSETGTGSLTPTPLPTTSTDMTTTLPTTTVPAQIDTAAAALQQAYTLYRQATASNKAGDIVAAAEGLAEANKQLANVDAAAMTPEVPLTAGELTTKIDTLFNKIYKSAAEQLRLLGQDEFRKTQYQTSLGYYLRAYALQPTAYGGGVAYYCGRNYQLLGQKKNARQYYDYVIRQFPGRDIAVSAQSRLKEMGY